MKLWSITIFLLTPVLIRSLELVDEADEVIVQKNTRPIPSLAFSLSTNKPPPSARVCGIPRLGPNSSIIEVRWSYRT